MSPSEEEDTLRKMVMVAGNTWLAQVLKGEAIDKRTKIVNSFRSGTSYTWDNHTQKGVTTVMPGRTDADREESIRSLLYQKPIEFWVQRYLNEFSLANLNYCLGSAMRQGYTYVIEVEMHH